MGIPEKTMKQVFEKLSEIRDLLDKAKVEYDKRNDDSKADKENSNNITLSILYLCKAYDEISAIKENDLEE